MLEEGKVIGNNAYPRQKKTDDDAESCYGKGWEVGAYTNRKVRNGGCTVQLTFIKRPQSNSGFDVLTKADGPRRK